MYTQEEIVQRLLDKGITAHIGPDDISEWLPGHMYYGMVESYYFNSISGDPGEERLIKLCKRNINKFPDPYENCGYVIGKPTWVTMPSGHEDDEWQVIVKVPYFQVGPIIGMDGGTIPVFDMEQLIAPPQQFTAQPIQPAQTTFTFSASQQLNQAIQQLNDSATLNHPLPTPGIIGPAWRI